MAVHRNRAGAPLDFIPLGTVSTTTATGIDEMYANIEMNIKAGWPRFNDLPEYEKIKGHQNPIVIVGGGPSLKRPEVFAELTAMYDAGAPIFAAGSSHDWLIKNGIHPRYTGVCDADPITARYTQEKNLHPQAQYLLASCVSKAQYDAVPKDRIVMWHCHSPEIQERIRAGGLEKHYYGVGGGCTIGLRAIALSTMLGYTNQHLFGFDSCVSEDEHHAYDFVDPEKEDLGQLIPIRIGNPQVGIPQGTTTYLCAGYQLAQVSHFKDYYLAHRAIFTPTIHGGGMMKALLDVVIRTIEIESERAAA